MSRIRPGTVIDERYEITGRLGKGGMGVVYEARQIGLERSVAIKMLLPDLAVQDEDRIRFQREARVMSRLRHDNAVQVFDYGEWDERLYLVMEQLHGQPLRARMVDGESHGVDEALTIAWQVADVLAASHELTLIHRDIKPENIVIEPRSDGGERVVVVDFGLAFIQNADPDVARLTTKGLISGTPQYMSPEQARGSDELGAPADVYALGGVLFELVTGHPPFKAAKLIDLINQHLFVPAPTMRELNDEVVVPAALEELVARMLAKSPFDRPTSADVRARLGQMIVGKTPRGRGRPDALNEPRSRRVLTGKPATAASALEGSGTARFGLNGPGATSTPPDGVRVAVVGDANINRLIALRAAELLPEQWGEHPGEPDVVFVVGGSDPDMTDRGDVPVVVEIEDGTPMSRVTDLMRAGVADVVQSTASDADVIRKLKRAVKSHRRRNSDET